MAEGSEKEKIPESSLSRDEIIKRIQELKDLLAEYSDDKNTKVSTSSKDEIIKRAEEPKEIPKELLWFGKRWVVLAIAAGILILLFAPLFNVTKTVSKTETVMMPVTTEEPVTIVSQNKIKVYTGWLKVTDRTSGSPGYYYSQPMILYGGGYPGQQGVSGLYAAQQYQQQQQTYSGYYSPYSYNYGSQTVTTTKVDPSDEITDVNYVRAPNNTWDISLISRDGKEKIIRDVNEYDLTKTGDITVDVTETKMKTITNQVPRQVTKDVPTQVRVSLFQLIFKIY